MKYIKKIVVKNIYLSIRLFVDNSKSDYNYAIVKNDDTLISGISLNNVNFDGTEKIDIFLGNNKGKGYGSY